MERCVDVVYARVSTRKQLDDLQSQAGRPAAQHPSARVIRDIGSGINFKRKGLLSLLELAFERRLRTVHVAHRDRLCRFAFDLVEHVLRKHGAEITVDAHGAEAATLSHGFELVEDVLSVVTVFGTRIHGRRSAGRRNVSNVPSKRVKTSAGSAQMPKAAAEPEQLKRKVGKRLRPLEGHLRTIKIRMLPDAPQRRELKRHFAAARWAYNSAVAGVERQHAAPNFINLRNGVLGAQRPEVAAAVHNKFLARAVKQAADAYASNFAKMRKRGATFRFRVQYRSYKKTPTETLVVERGKEGPFSGFTRRVPSEKPAGTTGDVRPKRRDMARPECLAHFGGALKAFGGVRLQDKPKVIERLIAEGKHLQEDAKILWDKRASSFHFVYTYQLPKLADPSPDFSDKRCLSADLGVKPPVQWYKPDGSHGTLFDGLCTGLPNAEPRSGELQRRCEKLDKLQSRVDRRKKRTGARDPTRKRRRTTRRLHRKLARDRRRLHNWMEACPLRRRPLPTGAGRCLDSTAVADAAAEP